MNDFRPGAVRTVYVSAQLTAVECAALGRPHGLLFADDLASTCPLSPTKMKVASGYSAAYSWNRTSFLPASAPKKELVADFWSSCTLPAGAEKPRDQRFGIKRGSLFRFVSPPSTVVTLP